MVKCRACGIDHPPGMRCEQAKRFLGFDRLKNPSDDAIRNVEVQIAAQASQAVRPEPGRLPEHAPVAAPCPICEARKEREREYMRKWRAKK